MNSNPKILAAFAAVLSVVSKLHLGIRAGGLTVPLPVLFAAAMVLAAAVLLPLAARSLGGFRSSPYPRTTWSTA
jgi:hypothetical protein